jgi:hypothetical protein
MSHCDMPVFYSHSEPVARKVHRCCECAAPIEVGEKHFYGRGKWDGEIDEYRQHLACMEACMLIRDRFEDGECIAFGELMDYYGEYRFDLRGDKRDEWTAKFRGLMAKILWRERKYRRRRKSVQTGAKS